MCGCGSTDNRQLNIIILAFNFIILCNRGVLGFWGFGVLGVLGEPETPQNDEIIFFQNVIIFLGI